MGRAEECGEVGFEQYWGLPAHGLGLGAVGKGSQAVGQCTGLRGWGGRLWGSVGARGSWCQGGLGAVGLGVVRSWDYGAGVGEKEALWQWVWGVGTWRICPSLAAACRVLGRGRHEYRKDCWPHCWGALNLGGG